jgi:hypothetical protein
MWFGGLNSVGTIYNIAFQYHTVLIIQKKNLKFQNNITVLYKLKYLKKEFEVPK